MDLFDFSKETELIAYIDLSNVFHWQRTLKWRFSIYTVVKQLISMKQVKEARIYYGINQRQLGKSENFHRKLRQAGAIVIAKPMKWIKKEIAKDLFVKPATLSRFDDNAHSKLDELVQYLKEQGFRIEEPKCNFDVEMALDMLDMADKISGIMLFSGDSDLVEPVKRIKLRGRSVYLFGVRGQVSKELIEASTKYINFGKWYKGPKSENPTPKSGTA